MQGGSEEEPRQLGLFFFTQKDAEAMVNKVSISSMFKTIVLGCEETAFKQLGDFQIPHC